MRCLAWGLVGILGCSTGAPPAERPYSAPVPVVELDPGGPAIDKPATESEAAPVDPFADGYREALPRRARLQRLGEVRLRSRGSVVNGPRKPSELGWWSPVVIFSERADRLRVVVDDGGARLLLWLDRGDFGTVVTRRVRLAASARDVARQAQGEAGVELLPGLAIETEARRGGGVQVRYGGTVRIAGWLPEEAVGEVYQPEAVSLPSFNASLRPGAELRAGPGGPVLLRVASSQPGDLAPPLPVERLGEEADGWFEVRLGERFGGGGEAGGYLARGHVAVSSLDPSPPELLGTLSGFGTGTGWGGGTKVTVPEGARFYDEHGDVVGIARKKVIARRWGAGEQRLRVELLTRWGPIKVEIDPVP